MANQAGDATLPPSPPHPHGRNFMVRAEPRGGSADSQNEAQMKPKITDGPRSKPSSNLPVADVNVSVTKAPGGVGGGTDTDCRARARSLFSRPLEQTDCSRVTVMRSV